VSHDDSRADAAHGVFGAREGAKSHEPSSAMSHEDEPGSDRVTALTHAFAEIDAQVFPGPGRGATPSEAAASDRWGGPSPATVEAYRRMFDVVAKHQREHTSTH
jgi:hypothetical protein